MSKKKFNKMWPDALSPERTRPKQSLILPQNNGVKYIPNMENYDVAAKSKKAKQRKAANQIILSKYKALGFGQKVGQKIEDIAVELVRLMRLKISGPINKMTVAEAISPDFFKRTQYQAWAKKNPEKARAVGSSHPADGLVSAEAAKEFYASWEWKRLSYDVKLKRGRKCECCGAQAPRVVIHTDHVKPIRKYWHLRLDPMNLQVLCEDCNMGKGSRDETDFRLLNTLDGAPSEPELSADEEMRLDAVRNQLRLN